MINNNYNEINRLTCSNCGLNGFNNLFGICFLPASFDALFTSSRLFKIEISDRYTSFSKLVESFRFKL